MLKYAKPNDTGRRKTNLKIEFSVQRMGTTISKQVISKEERAYHVNQWRKSGKSQKAYSEEAGISGNRLHYWTYGDPGSKPKYKRKAALPTFVPLQVEEEVSPSLEITLELPDGIRVHLQGQISASYIKSILS